MLLNVWLLTALGFTLFTLARLISKQRAPSRATSQPLILLRPVDAPTATELQNLDAPLPPHVEQWVLSPHRVGHHWHFSDPATSNRKAGHLIAAFARLPPSAVVLCVDADVWVTPALIDALVTPVLEGAELCSAAPSPARGRGLGAAALEGVLAGSHLSFRALDAVSFGAHPICGKALALGPAARTLFQTLGNALGEDLELAKLLHAQGHRVALASVAALMPAPPFTTFCVTLARMTRWLQTLRAHRPALHLTVPLLFTPTLPLVLLAPHRSSSLLLAALLVLARTSLSIFLGAGPWRWWLGEVTLALAFAQSLTTRTVRWRGREIRGATP